MEAAKDAVRRVVTIVYLSMIATVGAFAVLPRFLPVSRTAIPPAPNVEWGLFAIGAGEYLLVTFLGARLLTRRIGPGVERVRSYFLIRFAAAEAIAIFGLALFRMGAPASHAYGFFAASILAFLFAYPSREAFAEALRRAGDVES